MIYNCLQIIILHDMDIKIPELKHNTVYMKNMEVLWRENPDLAKLVDSVPDEKLIECEKTRSGDFTCRLMGDNEKLLYLHSRYDPIKEAEKWADGVMEKARQQQEKNEGRISMCYVIDGFGLGYHIEALHKRLKGDIFLVISENNLALIRTALVLRDFSEVLKDNKIIFITRNDRDEIFKRLYDIGILITLGIVFTRSMQNVGQNFHNSVHQALNEFVSFLRSHTISVLANSITTCTNIANNLRAYAECGPVNVLKNRFKGYPAVVVSAGPSLQKNIDLLKEIRDRVVVIAVQTTLRPLLAKGIKPDFVTSLDYHEVSKRFYEGLQDQLSDIHLIAEPKVSWHVLDKYMGHGPISILGNEFANLLLMDQKVKHDTIPAGATVAHLAFYLGQYMGTDPVIFIGQDLGYSNNVYYSPGNAVHEVWRPEMNRFYTVEMKEWERILRSRHMLKKVEDIYGNPIYTDDQMFTYLQQFEKDFAESPVKVIDATEGGVKKQYSEIMTLQEAADKYCTREIDKTKFEYRKDIINVDPEAREAALEQLKKRKEEIQELSDISEKTVVLVNKMLKDIENQEYVNKLMIELDELRSKVRHREKIYELVRSVSQMAEYYRFRADRELEVLGKDGIDRQRHQLQRDVGYVSEIRKGCDTIIGIINDAIERFKD